MQLTIHDSNLKVVGFINNDLPGALHYFDDNWHRYLTEGTSTFDFSVDKIHPSYAFLSLESYVSFTYNDEDFLFAVVNLKQDHTSMELQCVNLNMKLIEEDAPSYANTKRHSIVWYLKNAAQITDDVIEIGNNPFTEVDEAPSNPVLTFDSTETKLARILSICKSFNAEFHFRTVLKNDGTLQNISLDLYKKGGVGQVRKDVTLYYGRNVVGITSTGDRTSTFFNSLTVTDSNKKYNWLAVEGKVYNDEGQLEFYKDAGSNIAYAPLSREMFPSQLKNKNADRYTHKDLSTAATSNDSLWDYAVSQFKQFAYPQMTYEVIVASNAVTDALGNNKLLNIGDTVTIQDGTFDKSNGGLILSARVSEQEISFTNPANNKLTFTNFVQLKSDISADLYSRMKAMVDENTPYRSVPSTTNGTQFKNGQGSTTLTAHIYKGVEDVETKADSYEWFKDDVAVATAQTIQVDAIGINDKAVYRCQAVIDGKVVGTSEITLTNVNDGEAGPPGRKGDDGRSIVKMEQKYRVTTTDSTPTESWNDSGWSETQVATSPTNKYAWSITHVTYSSGTPLVQDFVQPNGVYGDTGEPGKPGPKGNDGDAGAPGKIVSDKEPTTKFVGLTWKYSGTSDMTTNDGATISAGVEYYWNGSKWEVSIMNVHNLNVDKLTALTPDLGDATAGSLTILKSENEGVSVKDGVVKSWGVSDVYDAPFPGEYSHTSMGVALDDGGLTFYSADYGHTMNDGAVITTAHEVATFKASASSDHAANSNSGLVLDVSNPNFPLSIKGNITVGNLAVTGNLSFGRVHQAPWSTSYFSNGQLNLMRIGSLVFIMGWANTHSILAGTSPATAFPYGFKPDASLGTVRFVTTEGHKYEIGTDGKLTFKTAIPAGNSFTPMTAPFITADSFPISPAPVTEDDFTESTEEIILPDDAGLNTEEGN